MFAFWEFKKVSNEYRDSICEKTKIECFSSEITKLNVDTEIRYKYRKSVLLKIQKDIEIRWITHDFIFINFILIPRYFQMIFNLGEI